jgi:hypothetical protein
MIIIHQRFNKATSSLNQDKVFIESIIIKDKTRILSHDPQE